MEFGIGLLAGQATKTTQEPQELKGNCYCSVPARSGAVSCVNSPHQAKCMRGLNDTGQVAEQFLWKFLSLAPAVDHGYSVQALQPP